MNSSILSRLLVSILVACVIPMVTFADPNLTPEQLVLLMKASRERYNTFDEKIKVANYQETDNKTKATLTLDIISRWTKNKQFSRIIRTEYLLDETPHEGYTPTIIKTYIIAKESSKRLIEAPDNRSPRGYVAPGMSLELEQDQGFYGTYGAMWNLFSAPWEKMNLNESTSSFDNTSKCYILNVPMGAYPKAPLFILYIDPSKDYIPVKKEYVKKYDGTVIAILECSDFRQTESGLWIPYRYSWSDPRKSLKIVYKVEQVKVNETIADSLFDFTFPAGTIVYDERYNLRYTVGETRQAQQPIVDPCSLTSTGVIATSPAKDEELLASASKAKELLQAHAGVVEALPSIEVSPAIVLVIANRYEYSLSVIRPDGTKPQLLSYGFESDTLEFLSLKDLIQDKSQLIINIKRLQSHTGFASGTLLLQFEKEKEPVKVTFVSAPLPNTP